MLILPRNLWVIWEIKRCPSSIFGKDLFTVLCSPYFSIRGFWTHAVYIPSSWGRCSPTGKVPTCLLALWRIIMVKITKIKSTEISLFTKIINQMVHHITGEMTEMSTTTETWKMNISWLFYQISRMGLWKGE